MSAIKILYGYSFICSKACIEFSVILPGLEPQIPHYNARLKAMLDNEVNFSVAEALSEIESKGLTPNRVWVYCLSSLIPF